MDDPVTELGEYRPRPAAGDDDLRPQAGLAHDRNRPLYRAADRVERARLHRPLRAVGEYLHARPWVESADALAIDAAGIGHQRAIHEMQPGDDLAAEVLARPIQRIDRNRRTRVNDAQGGFHFMACTDHCHPAVNAQAPRTLVGIAYAERFSFGAREAQVAAAVQADEAGQFRAEIGAGHVTRESMLDLARQFPAERRHV